MDTIFPRITLKDESDAEMSDNPDSGEPAPVLEDGEKGGPAVPKDDDLKDDIPPPGEY